MTIGERIKQRRELLKLSREDISNMTGISYSQVGRYETDVNQPTSDVILALARVLQVSTDWLLGTSDVYGMASLTDLEQQALAILRSKPPERQKTLVDVMKVF